MPPPPIPWIALHTINHVIFCAAPHKADATRKTVTTVKSKAVYQMQLSFSNSSEEIKFNIFDKMESEAKEAKQNVDNPAYA